MLIDKFPNRRQWREFIAAVQCSVAYPKVLAAWRHSTQRVNERLFNETLPVAAEHATR